MKQTIKFQNSPYSIWKPLFIFLLVFIIDSCPLFGQESPKNVVSPADYNLWSTMDFKDVSNNGNWVTYNMRHTNGNDTLWVRHTTSDKTYNIPGGYKACFVEESYWMGLNSSGQLIVQNFKNENRQIFDKVSFYQVAKKEQVLILASRIDATNFSLRLINLKSYQTIKTFLATAYSLSPSGEKLAYATYKNGETQLRSISIGGLLSRTLTKLHKERISKIIWEPHGKAIAFTAESMEKKHKTALYHYGLSNQRLTFMQPEKTKGFPIDRQLRTQIEKDFYFSEDGKSIFVTLEKDKDTTTINPLDPEVWNTLDKREYPRRVLTGSVKDWQGTAVWYPKEGSFFWFTEGFTDYNLIPHKDMAIVSSVEGDTPKLTYFYDPEYYLVDLKKRTKKILAAPDLEKPDYLKVAPSGNYILYFTKKSGWFVYDLKSKQHRNISKLLPTSTIGQEFAFRNSIAPYGFGGFTKEEDAILLYDRYDIWKVHLYDDHHKRLTRGREKQLRFRVVPKKKVENATMDSPLIDLDKKQLLKATNLDKSIQGYYYWNVKEKPWIMGNNRSNAIKRAQEKDVFVYVRQDFSTPPALMVARGWGGKPQQVFQSNPHYKNYLWGKAEHIQYRNKKGKSLKACLFYPAGYDPQKKYPMVVEVYEKKASLLHLYHNPSWYNSDGFNVSNLTQKGYFVLLPDIYIDIGTAGDNAVDCVTAAISVALDTPSIDPKSIGLMGHSFGGFETNYILTKSKLFAAGVSGGSITDLISSSFSITPAHGYAEYAYHEGYQTSMMVSFFEDKDRYMKNSPVFHADGIQVPLLLWSGKKETRVPYQQSIELFLALRRLGKPAVMLLYPEGGHSLFNRHSQKNLTQKTEKWFDYYLKDSSKPDWALPQ